MLYAKGRGRWGCCIWHLPCVIALGLNTCKPCRWLAGGDDQPLAYGKIMEAISGLKHVLQWLLLGASQAVFIKLPNYCRPSLVARLPSILLAIALPPSLCHDNFRVTGSHPHHSGTHTALSLLRVTCQSVCEHVSALTARHVCAQWMLWCLVNHLYLMCTRWFTVI